MTDTRVIAFLGLGVMGTPMALNIARAGLHVETYDVLDEARSRARDTGLRVVDDVADLGVLLDGAPIGDERGADVGPDGAAHLDRAGMVRLVAGASRDDDHLLTLSASQPGLRAYVFTFGP